MKPKGPFRAIESSTLVFFSHLFLEKNPEAASFFGQMVCYKQGTSSGIFGRSPDFGSWPKQRIRHPRALEIPPVGQGLLDLKRHQSNGTVSNVCCSVAPILNCKKQ